MDIQYNGFVVELGYGTNFAQSVVQTFGTYEKLVETSPSDVQSLLSCSVLRAERLLAYARLVLKRKEIAEGTGLDAEQIKLDLGYTPDFCAGLVTWFFRMEVLAQTSAEDIQTLTKCSLPVAKTIAAYAKVKVRA